MSDLVIWGRTELSQLRKEFEKQIEEFCRDWGLPRSRPAGLRIEDRGDVLEAVLPVGDMRPSDLEIQVFERRIIIRGGRGRSSEGGSEFTGFLHEASLPSRVDPGESIAGVKGEMLVVTMPKAQETRGRVIRIEE